ncbi:MAG TPA: hypothetical protein VGJ18_01020 [Gemmatimonadaceae bacterium]
MSCSPTGLIVRLVRIIYLFFRSSSALLSRVIAVVCTHDCPVIGFGSPRSS